MANYGVEIKSVGEQQAVMVHLGTKEYLMAKISCLLSILAYKLPGVFGKLTELTSVESPTEIIKSILHCKKIAIPKMAINLLSKCIKLLLRIIS